MRMWGRGLIFAFLVGLTGSASAGAFAPPNKVTRLLFWQGHAGVLITQANTANPDSCPRTDQYILRQDHPFFKEVYALLLSAHSSGKAVAVYAAGCYDGFPTVVHVQSDGW